MKRDPETADGSKFHSWSLGCIAILVSFAAVVAACTDSDDAPRTDAEAANLVTRFPDFGFAPPATDYNGPLFELSQDYPTTLPDEDLPAFLDIDFSKDEAAAIEYLEAVLDYSFEGNEEVDFRVEDNTVRDWYHMPWQHYGAAGREGIHGLTREAVAQPQQLADTQTADFSEANAAVGGKFSTWAVGFYNSFGGYTIGQTWANPLDPQAGYVFPEGTVVFKLLFTEAGKENGVDYLENPQAWDAYIYDHPDNGGEGLGSEPVDAKRSVQKVNLIQMDIMVRDDRTKDGLSGTGWVFGTYLYNGTLDPDGGFRNLVPLGLQWGNDPDYTDPNQANSVMCDPAKPAECPDNTYNPIRQPWTTPTVINSELKETVINSSPDVPFTHLGWGSRLSGPVDYFRSSCQSCHATAEWPAVSPLGADLTPPGDVRLSTAPYQPGGAEWNRWFQNLPLGEPFDEEAKTTDNILQMVISIRNFTDAKSAAEGGVFMIDGYPNGINHDDLDPDDLNSRDLSGPAD